MAFCLLRVSQAIFPATAFGLEPQRWQQGTAFRTIKFKPWDVGQAQPICCTSVLLQSRCLDCLSSCLSRPLIDSLFQVLWGSVSCARFCVANFGSCWCCPLLSWTWPRDSQLFSGESLRIGSLCWVQAYWFQRPIDPPSEPLASVSSAFGVVCIVFIFMCRVVGFGA